MKIIGKESSDRYICVIGHTELEKFMNLYYRNLKELSVGDIFDLGKGYDHAAEIANAMRTTKQFIADNQKVVSAILNGLHYEKIMAAEPPKGPA